MAVYNPETKEFYCECGCGKVILPWNSWFIGHHPKIWSEESRAGMGERMSNYWTLRPKSKEHIENQRESQRKFWLSEEGMELAYSRVESTRGEKNHRWKGGFGSIPYGTDWSDYRITILERDSYTCQGCGSKLNLCVHHIDEDSDNWDERNLITACTNCNIWASSSSKREYWFNFFTRRIKEIYGKEKVGVSDLLVGC